MIGACWLKGSGENWHLEVLRGGCAGPLCPAWVPAGRWAPGSGERSLLGSLAPALS